MHGVGETLPGLSDFRGRTLLAVEDLDSIVYFRFEAEHSIGVESSWTVHDATGAVVADRVPIGRVVVAAETQPPRTIRLRFDSGHTLTIVDDSDEHESFCIPHAGVYI